MSPSRTARGIGMAGRATCAFLLAGAILAAPVESVAQVRPRRAPPVARDTVAQPPDTAAAAATDTTAAAAPADTTPPPQLPRFPGEAAAGWSTGVWTWDRTDLLATGALTLTDLLERVPGVTTIRYGFVGLPEMASAFGGNGGRIELLLDGFAVDPLGGSGVDLSRIELATLESVRIERRLGVLRIELETLFPQENAAYSRIEAGTGDLGTDLLRGLFLAPRFLGGSVGLGVERLASDGIGFDEPAENFGAWAKWTLAAQDRGLQLEYRRSNISREARDSLGPFEGKRNDLVLRARTRLGAGLVTEAFVGRSAAEDVTADTLRTSETGTQAGIRAGVRGENVRAGTSVRWRSNRGLPTWDAELAAGASAGRVLDLDGTIRVMDWREGERATSASLRVQLGPFLGIRPVAEWYTGTSGAPFLVDTAGSPVLTERTAYRAGGELVLGGFQLRGAGLRLEADSVPDLGLADAQPERFRYPGGEVDGLEVMVRIPTPWRPLYLEGWYTRWLSGRTWIYLPEASGRAGIAFHDTPLKSGNLELLARLEARHRGAMLVPGVADPGDDGAGETPAPDPLRLEIAPAATTLDFYFQFRIKDVRAFLRWENIMNRRGLWDVPGRELPGQRIFYGVKWQFRN